MTEETKSTESSSLPENDKAPSQPAAPTVDVNALKAEFNSQLEQVKIDAAKQLQDVSKKARDEAINSIVDALKPQEKRELHETQKQFFTDPEGFVSNVVSKARDVIKEEQSQTQAFEQRYRKVVTPIVEEIPELTKYDDEFQSAMVKQASADPNADLATVAKRAADYCAERYGLTKLSEAEIEAKRNKIAMASGSGSAAGKANNKSSAESFMDKEVKRSLQLRNLNFN